ncbi:MAG: ornithine carbamoyltransferase [Anaerolineae bacterium]|nr:ornithine carbamoyltransferase [Anaerolineae bacterium]
MKPKHYLDITKWSPEDMQELLDLAVFLKREWKSGGNRPVLKGKVLGMVFQKPSLRTRVSFEVGMKHLGGDALYLSPAEIGLGKRESIADVARVLSGYVQGIMARVFEHQHVLDLARWASVPVINGLSDFNHPCQALADMLTIYEHYGKLEGLKVAFVGDGNNVATSLLFASAKLGVNFSIASPPGYALDSSVLVKAAPYAETSGITIETHEDPIAAVAEADVIYTDTWTSMGQEDEAAVRREKFGRYQVNNDLLAKAGRKAMVMHCLPAHRGEEITDEVADGMQSLLFPQAENRMHAQKALLVTLMA